MGRIESNQTNKKTILTYKQEQLHSGLDVYFQVIPYFVYVSSRGSGKTADNQNLMCWLNCFLLLVLNRGSYMSAHVLLNLLNELGKRDKM